MAFISAGPEFCAWAEHMAGLGLLPRLLLPRAPLTAGYANLGIGGAPGNGRWGELPTCFHSKELNSRRGLKLANLPKGVRGCRWCLQLTLENLLSSFPQDAEISAFELRSILNKILAKRECLPPAAAPHGHQQVSPMATGAQRAPLTWAGSEPGLAPDLLLGSPCGHDHVLSLLLQGAAETLGLCQPRRCFTGRVLWQGTDGCLLSQHLPLGIGCQEGGWI